MYEHVNEKHAVKSLDKLNVYNYHLKCAADHSPFMIRCSDECSYLQLVASPLPVEAADLGTGSAAQLTSPQGCNHLWQHLLITEGCLDYHIMFNGKLPYDEFHNLHHKQHYSSRVLFPESFLQISAPKSSFLWEPQAQHTVKIALRPEGKVGKKKESIKPDTMDANCALIFK